LKLDKPVILGHISGVYGVKGWVRVFSETSEREGIIKYKNWFLSRDGINWESRKLINGRAQGKGVVVQLAGCDDRDVAATMIDLKIAIEQTDLPPTKEGEYYWSDLEGLVVSTIEGVELGSVSHLFETGANAVVVVKGDKERLIPYLMGQVIKKINLEENLMMVDWDPEF